MEGTTDTTLDEASAVAERLRRVIEESLVVTSHRQLRVTVSQGVTEFIMGFDKETLVNNADRALLKAKRSGKNRVVVFNEEMAVS